MFAVNSFTGKALRSFAAPPGMFGRPALDSERGILYCLKQTEGDEYCVVGIAVADGSLKCTLKCSFYANSRSEPQIVYQRQTGLLWLSRPFIITSWTPAGVDSSVDSTARMPELAFWKRALLACDEQGLGELYAIAPCGKVCRVDVNVFPEKGMAAVVAPTHDVVDIGLDVGSPLSAVVFARRLFVCSVNTQYKLIDVYDLPTCARLGSLDARPLPNDCLSASTTGALFVGVRRGPVYVLPLPDDLSARESADS